MPPATESPAPLEPELLWDQLRSPTSDVLTGIDQLAVDQATSTVSSGNVKIMMITDNVDIEVEITTPGGTEALGDLADEQRAAAMQLAESVIAAFQSQAEPVR